ncbi:DUF6482 family protein [Paraferrimonas sedimenticola]|uniref:Uncharacterized protein n=1 Tax=Paraferrimonas sedimenticola TaxID=375674 RepID=A0AA37RWH0_9GAMM|nr:DUF6482 family protein [Paraferrimonas sedimenticola]GLP96980.1 hypothetical protein GCM10007895_22860 [Paraferrimonas sedimenticola]
MSQIATIIAVADSTHYLVGATDASGDFIAMPSLQSVQVCKSLFEAKELLREQQVSTAQLTFMSAYDEMCGLPSSQPMRQTITL